MPSAAQHRERRRVLIVAYGNQSRRDDGVAFYIAQALAKRLDPDREVLLGQDWETDQVSVRCLHQLAPELVEEMVEHSSVIFIDAHVASAGWKPVSWHKLEAEYRPSMVSHHLNPSTLLALCETLYGQAPKAVLLSIEGSDFDFGESLSERTAELAEQATEYLWIYLQREDTATEHRVPSQNHKLSGER